MLSKLQKQKLTLSHTHHLINGNIKSRFYKNIRNYKIETDRELVRELQTFLNRESTPLFLSISGVISTLSYVELSPIRIILCNAFMLQQIPFTLSLSPLQLALHKHTPSFMLFIVYFMHYFFELHIKKKHLIKSNCL